MEATRKVSEEFFDSESPPKKKSRTSFVEFEDGSDDSEEELATIPIELNESFANESDEETPPRDFLPDTERASNQKHPDLDDQRVRTFVKSMFNEKVHSLTLKQLGIPVDSDTDVQSMIITCL